MKENGFLIDCCLKASGFVALPKLWRSFNLIYGFLSFMGVHIQTSFFYYDHFFVVIKQILFNLLASYNNIYILRSMVSKM